MDKMTFRFSFGLLIFFLVFVPLMYNSSQDALYILPSLKNYLYRTGSPYTMTEMVKSNIVSRWLSIDNADNNKHEILTGYNHPDPMKKIWQYDCSDNNHCVSRSYYNNVEMQVVERDSVLVQEVIRPAFEDMVYTPKAEKSKIEKICAP